MSEVIRTADLVDSHEAEVRFCAEQWMSFGRKEAFHGEIVTLKTFEDNRLLRETLGEDGAGRVLVVDGGGSLRCALVGDQIAAMAARNGWQGLVIRGAIRDSAELDGMDFRVLALGRTPIKSGKTGHGQRDVPVRFGNVEFRPGHYLYADADGVLVADRPLHTRKA